MIKLSAFSPPCTEIIFWPVAPNPLTPLHFLAVSKIVFITAMELILCLTITAGFATHHA